MSGRDDFDIAIVGAGIAGCTAARLYGELGFRVALVDRRTEIDDYKRICTHFIQPSATPVIDRLGLASLIEEAGGVRNSLETWTRWGWIRVSEPEGGGSHPFGYSIRRQTLDPMLRELAAKTPGVELMMDRTAENLLSTEGRFSGVSLRSSGGVRQRISARLLVAADGRDSRLGELAGVRARQRANNRFTYFAYYRNLAHAPGMTGRMWVLEPDTAIAYPNDEDISVVACFVDKKRLPEFKRDPEASFEKLIGSLPGGPSLSEAERVSPLLGKLQMPNHSRRTAVPGLAFVGDAAMASDPLWAVGCGWAFQSAAWLVDSTTEPLMAEKKLDAALRRYRRKHRSELLPFYLQSANFSTARGLLPHEKLLLSSATKDPVTARRFTAFGEGLIGIGELLSPWSLGRALRVRVAHRVEDQRSDVGTWPVRAKQ
ncbi:MAG TPA: NAD(P)/FAD-dependent oxidoreductase [Solirubrobacterales bacterium]|nr:NAD(P)/FAD-dependent oxidoreductase [Solirubrobacterales bacterium]